MPSVTPWYSSRTLAGHHFISYSKAEPHAQDFARTLVESLRSGQSPVHAWLDEVEIDPGTIWDEEIENAIATCTTLLFVMSQRSVEHYSECKKEWALALSFKKPVIPLLLDADVRAPFRLIDRHYLDFTGAFEPGLVRLREYLVRLSSPVGVLEQLKIRHREALSDLRRIPEGARRARTQADVELLEKQIAEQERVVADPDAAARRAADTIARGLERERQPERPSPSLARDRFINPPPSVAPTYFQDRVNETRRVGEFLQDGALRMLTIVGRGGTGKTALVCRLLKGLEAGRLPDDGASLSVDGIVYLSCAGARRASTFNLYSDLCKLLPPEAAQRLDALYKSPDTSTATKIDALLKEFPRGLTVVLLDNFEDALDPATSNIADTELADALQAFLDAPPHAVKLLVTTRVAPKGLALTQPGRQERIDLDEGLASPYAENILREMDKGDTLGLKSAPAELLNQARERTRGYPRALEALFAILSADRDTSLPEILSGTSGVLPDTVVKVLVGEAFNRLDGSAQQVMQALAIYIRPVPAVAVDYLLRAYSPAVDSAPVLNRLVNMQFVRKEGGRYYLHPVDREYALARIPAGDRSDRRLETPPFTQFALRHIAANYFRDTRKTREEWKTLDDLAPQLAEFDVRCDGDEYDMAASVLETIHYFYLYTWGHYRLMITLHERIKGRVDDPYLREKCLGHLGIAYAELGDVRSAIEVTELALEGARGIRNATDEVLWLGNLGTLYRDLGDSTRALQFFEQSWATNRRQDGYLQGVNLIYRGECYSDLGETDKAAECLGRGIPLIERSQVPEASARTGGAHATLSLVMLDIGRLDTALTEAKLAVRLGHQSNSPKTLAAANAALCLTTIVAGDFAAAREAAEAAERLDQAGQNHLIHTLLGIIGLREGNAALATTALTEAVQDAERMLKHNEHAFRAFDCMGVALAAAQCSPGLGSPGLGSGGLRDMAPAIEAHRRARRINHDAGVVSRVLRLYDALAPIDPTGLLAPARAAAGALDSNDSTRVV